MGFIIAAHFGKADGFGKFLQAGTDLICHGIGMGGDGVVEVVCHQGIKLNTQQSSLCQHTTALLNDVTEVFHDQRIGDHNCFTKQGTNLGAANIKHIAKTRNIGKGQIITIYRTNYEMKVFGEPQLGKRGLYPTISQKGSYDAIQDMMNFMAYADGKNSLLEIAERIGADALNLIPIAQKLLDNGLVMYEK